MMKFCLWLDFLHASLFISMYHILVDIITQSGIYKRGISISAYMLGKRDINSAASNDLYLCGIGMQSVYIVLFQTFLL
jgi:hypothetical protein